MKQLKQFFPFSFKTDTMKELIVAIAVYLIASLVSSIVFGLLDGLPLIGFIFSLAGGIAGLYCLVGIVLAVLNFMKLLKN